MAYLYANKIMPLSLCVSRGIQAAIKFKTLLDYSHDFLIPKKSNSLTAFLSPRINYKDPEYKDVRIEYRWCLS